MILLQVGWEATQPRQHIIRKFPCVIGRSSTAEVVMQSPGIWDRHLTIELDERERRFRFQIETGAIAFRNRERVQEGWLKNGDLFQLGSSEILVSLAPASQKPLNRMELGAWLLLVCVILVELGLVFVLRRGF
jgi:pSer/pThr/pTyr-binding forkhead associated (FHA) protein